jgi:putative ABC transport system ATP-binding protein
MSGGEQQRLAFARAVVAGHRLVIADEPTAELDAASAETVLDTVDTLAASGVTVLLATHDPRVLRRIDQVVTLRDGAIASITRRGTELAIIDRSGRLQLPPEVRARFPDRTAVLEWDDDEDTLRVDPP